MADRYPDETLDEADAAGDGRMEEEIGEAEVGLETARRAIEQLDPGSSVQVLRDRNGDMSVTLVRQDPETHKWYEVGQVFIQTPSNSERAIVAGYVRQTVWAMERLLDNRVPA
jgi:hypothetical protein